MLRLFPPRETGLERQIKLSCRTTRKAQCLAPLICGLKFLLLGGSPSGSLVNHVLDDITRVPVVLMANVSDKAEAAVSRGEVVQESLLICNPGSRRWE